MIVSFFGVSILIFCNFFFRFFLEFRELNLKKRESEWNRTRFEFAFVKDGEKLKKKMGNSRAKQNGRTNRQTNNLMTRRDAQSCRHRTIDRIVGVVSFCMKLVIVVIFGAISLMQIVAVVVFIIATITYLITYNMRIQFTDFIPIVRVLA